ncbi:MAG: hypothetical protein DRP71_10395 [Verrucomicrobia bacterium]|nr:MAG: hypothetical protein DRP71_10395 [Verrucomicrobiota bacterium]
MFQKDNQPVDGGCHNGHTHKIEYSVKGREVNGPVVRGDAHQVGQDVDQPLERYNQDDGKGPRHKIKDHMRPCQAFALNTRTD